MVHVVRIMKRAERALLQCAGVSDKPAASVGSSGDDCRQRCSEHLPHQHIAPLPVTTGVGVCWDSMDRGKQPCLFSHSCTPQLMLSSAEVHHFTASGCSCCSALTKTLYQACDNRLC